MCDEITIRKAKPSDQAAVWEIIKQVIRDGETYVFRPDSSKETMVDYWFGPKKFTYVAEVAGSIAGTIILCENQPGLGNHISNAAFMTHKEFRGQGVGTAMGKFALTEAKNQGFRAMQFNMVVKSNEHAINLWKKLGFQVIGEIPAAFRHPTLGSVNALIMWKSLLTN